MAETGFTSGADGTIPRIVKTDDVLSGDPRIKDHRVGICHVYRRFVYKRQRTLHRRSDDSSTSHVRRPNKVDLHDWINFYK